MHFSWARCLISPYDATYVQLQMDAVANLGSVAAWHKRAFDSGSFTAAAGYPNRYTADCVPSSQQSSQWQTTVPNHQSFVSKT